MQCPSLPFATKLALPAATISRRNVAALPSVGRALRGRSGGPPAEPPGPPTSAAPSSLSSATSPARCSIAAAGYAGAALTALFGLAALFGKAARRTFSDPLLGAAVMVGVTASAAAYAPPPATAFPNAIPEAAEYANLPKVPGQLPDGLGIQKRPEIDGDPGLKPCGTKQTCFSSTPRVPELDRQYLPPWRPPVGLAPEAALAQLKGVVERYPPGQAGIDGGGFQIMTSTPEYLYVQFESLKEGNIDDVEFGVDGLAIAVRSASRVGFVDRGVNCLRLNWIAGELRNLGWDAPAITKATHPLYFSTNYEFLLMKDEIAAAKGKRYVFEDLRMRLATPETEVLASN